MLLLKSKHTDVSIGLYVNPRNRNASIAYIFRARLRQFLESRKFCVYSVKI